MVLGEKVAIFLIVTANNFSANNESCWPPPTCCLPPPTFWLIAIRIGGCFCHLLLNSAFKAEKHALSPLVFPSPTYLHLSVSSPIL